MNTIQAIANSPVRKRVINLTVNRDLRHDGEIEGQHIEGFETQARRLGFAFTVISPDYIKMQDLDGRRVEVQFG